jgi:hypothetical protein
LKSRIQGQFNRARDLVKVKIASPVGTPLPNVEQWFHCFLQNVTPDSAIRQIVRKPFDA